MRPAHRPAHWPVGALHKTAAARDGRPATIRQGFNQARNDGQLPIRTNGYNVNIRAQPYVNFFPGWDVHRLALSFEVHPHGDYAEDAPFLVSGTLWTHDMPNPASWIGVLHAASGPIGLKSFGTMLTLETIVTDQQLRGLEKMRAGADLTLRANLTLTALAEAKHWPVASDQEVIRIPHATWSNAITQLDAGAFVDVLIPITEVEDRTTAA